MIMNIKFLFMIFMNIYDHYYSWSFKIINIQVHLYKIMNTVFKITIKDMNFSH